MRATLIFLAVGLTGCQMSQEDQAKFRMQVRAERLITSSLKDPSSVEFGDATYVKSPERVCSSYNAKNSFGGYAGAKRFTYDGRILTVEDYSPDFATVWVNCIGARPISDPG